MIGTKRTQTSLRTLTIKNKENLQHRELILKIPSVYLSLQNLNSRTINCQLILVYSCFQRSWPYILVYVILDAQHWFLLKILKQSVLNNAHVLPCTNSSDPILTILCISQLSVRCFCDYFILCLVKPCKYLVRYY